MAQEHGVSIDELSSISGTGAGGRVNKKDFELYLASRTKEGVAPASSISIPSTNTTPASAPSVSSSGRVEVIAMDNEEGNREKYGYVKANPHVNSVEEVDLTLILLERALKMSSKNRRDSN